MHQTDWQTPDTYSLLARLLCLTSYITFKWDFSQCYLGNKLKISRQGLGLSLIIKALSVRLSGVWFVSRKGKSRHLSMGRGENPYGKLTPTGLIVSDCTVRRSPTASSLCHSEFRIKWVQADESLCVFLGERGVVLFVVQCRNIHFIQ